MDGRRRAIVQRLGTAALLLAAWRQYQVHINFQRRRLLMLAAELRESRPRRPLVGQRIDLDELAAQPERAMNLFRFTIDEVRILCDAMRLPEVILTPGRLRIPAAEGLCLLLLRFAHTLPLFDLVERFGRSIGAMSDIINHMVTLLNDRIGHVLELNEVRIRANVARFAGAIRDRGAPVEKVWGFVDGTGRRISRPTRDQELFYSGHSREHNLKFLSIITPDGLFSYLGGPFVGRHHDMFMWQQGDLEERLSRLVPDYYLYGDSGFAVLNSLVGPYRAPEPGSIEQTFNIMMSQVRVTVEWGFGRVLNLFPFLDSHRILRTGSSPVSAYYRVAVILCNLRTILDGRNEISDQFFSGSAHEVLPTVHEYLAPVSSFSYCVQYFSNYLDRQTYILFIFEAVPLSYAPLSGRARSAANKAASSLSNRAFSWLSSVLSCRWPGSSAVGAAAGGAGGCCAIALMLVMRPLIILINVSFASRCLSSRSSKRDTTRSRARDGRRRDLASIDPAESSVSTESSSADAVSVSTRRRRVAPT